MLSSFLSISGKQAGLYAIPKEVQPLLRKKVFMKIQLSTYSAGQLLYGSCFFILNKGMNSGKPSFSPWRNCFVAQFDSDNELDYAYWICYGLWVTRKLHPFLNGSVIPFITKDDLMMALSLADAAIHDHRDLYMRSIESIWV